MVLFIRHINAVFHFERLFLITKLVVFKAVALSGLFQSRTALASRLNMVNDSSINLVFTSTNLFYIIFIYI